MDPLYLLLICVSVVAFIAWRLLSGARHGGQNQESTKSASKGATKLPQPPYRAMTLSICTNACVAAKRIRYKSFLVAEVPKLPLPNCDRPCHCQFAIHDDRRIKEDRRYESEDIFQDTTTLDVGRGGSRRGKNNRRRKTAPYQGIY